MARFQEFGDVQQPRLAEGCRQRALLAGMMHRKNPLFYKTQNGADVGDLYMGLIHTCELNGVNPFDYLNALQRHPDAVASDPTAWPPWNYRDQLLPAAD